MALPLPEDQGRGHELLNSKASTTIRYHTRVFEDGLNARGAVRTATGIAWERGRPTRLGVLTAAPDAYGTSALPGPLFAFGRHLLREKIWRQASAIRDPICETH
jgi:hypothetical protein